MSDEEEGPKQDVIGIVSMVIGLLTWVLCFGSCIPYLNILTIFPSMILSLFGSVLGGVGIAYARNNEIEPGFSVTGLVLNGIPLFIWVCYWLFNFLMLLMVFVGVMVIGIIEATS